MWLVLAQVTDSAPVWGAGGAVSAIGAMATSIRFVWSALMESHKERLADCDKARDEAIEARRAMAKQLDLEQAEHRETRHDRDELRRRLEASQAELNRRQTQLNREPSDGKKT